MHAIDIRAAYMSSVNNRYHHISLQSVQLYLTLIEYTQRSQNCDPILQQACGRKLCLGTDKFNKWLREALFINKPFHEGPDLCLGLHYLDQSSSSKRNPPSGSVGSSKT